MRHLAFLIALAGIYLPGFTQTTDDIYQDGMSKAQDGDYNGAIADFTAVIATDPGSTTNEDIKSAYFNRGVCEQALHEDIDASSDFIKVTQIDPYDGQAWNFLGYSYFAMGDYHNDIDAQTKALAIQPDAYDAYYERGAAELKYDDPQGAVADFSMAIQLKPNDPDAYYERGVANDASNNFQDAINDFTTSLTIKPGAGDALLERGRTKYNMKVYNGAIEDYTASMNATPLSGIPQYMRGLAKFAMGDKAGACDDWKGALQLGASDAQEQIDANCK